MKKITLGVLLFLLFCCAAVVKGQVRTDTLRTAFGSCFTVGNRANVQKSLSAGEGYSSGTWRGLNNDGQEVYINMHGVRFSIPNVGTSARLKALYVLFNDESEVVGTADEYAITVFEVNGQGQLINPRTVNFNLSGRNFPSAEDFNLYTPARRINMNDMELTPGGSYLIAMTTNRIGADDTLSFYFTDNDDTTSNTCNPHNWRLFFSDAATGAGIDTLDYNQFFDVITGSPIWAPEVEFRTEACALNLTVVSQTPVGCATPGRIEVNVTGAPAASLAYAWFDPSNNRIATATTNVLANISMPGQYRVEVSVPTRPECAPVSNTFNVTQETLNKPVVTPAGTIRLPIDTPLTTPVVTDAIYQWRLNGNDIAGATRNTHMPTAAGRYAVRINKGSCTASSEEVIAVMTNANDATVCPGTCATLRSTITGTNYSWTPAAGLNSRTERQVTACPARTTRYTVRITGPGNLDTTQSYLVTVNQLPNVSITPSGATQFCIGGQVILTVNNDARFEYQWFRNGAAIAGQTTNRHTTNQSGVYTVRLRYPSDTTCQVFSNPMNVESIPISPFKIEGYPYLCSTGFTDLEIRGGDPEAVFEWTPQQNIQTQRNGRIARFTAPAGGTGRTLYTVRTTNSLGCVAQDTVNVQADNTIFSRFLNLRTTYCTNNPTTEFEVGPFGVGVSNGSLVFSPPLPAGALTVVEPNKTYRINPTLLPIGAYAVVWSGSYNGCPFSVRRTFNVVAGEPVALTGLDNAYCVTRVGTVPFSGSPAGGTLTVTPATGLAITGLPNGPNYTISPSTSVPGTYQLVYSGTAPSGCEYRLERSISIVVNNQLSTLDTLPERICSVAGPFEFSANPNTNSSRLTSNQQQAFTRIGVTNRYEFDPTKVNFPIGVDSIFVDVQYTSDPVDGCIVGPAADRVLVVRATVSVEGLTDRICRSAEPIILTASPGNGSFLGEFPSDAIERIGTTNQFRLFPSRFEELTYNIEYTGINGNCPYSRNFVVTFDAPPATASIEGLSDTYTTNSPTAVLRGLPASDVEDLQWRSTSGAVNSRGEYRPALAFPNRPCPTPGTLLDEVTYSGRIGGCTFSVSRFVTVICIDSTSDNLADTVCVSSAPIEFEMTDPGAFDDVPAGITLISGSGNLRFRFDPSVPGPGEFNYRFRISGTSNTVNVRVFVEQEIPSTSVQFSSNTLDPLCSTGGFITITATQPPRIRFTGRFFGNGVDTLTGTVDLRKSDGRVRYIKRSRGCPFDSLITLNLTIVNEAILGLPDTLCIKSGQVQLLGTPSGGRFSGPGVTDTLGTAFFDPSRLNDGNGPRVGEQVVITYAGTFENCRYSTTDAIIFSDDRTTASIIGLLPEYCSNADTVRLSGFPTGGEFSGNRVVSNKFIPDVPGTYVITYAGEDANGCRFEGKDTTVVAEAPDAEIIAGGGTAICAGNTLQIEASPSDAQFRYRWLRDSVAFGSETNQTLELDRGGYFSVEVENANNNCRDTSDVVFINVLPNDMSWDGRITETTTLPPVLCQDDATIIVTVAERFPGERYNFFIRDDKSSDPQFSGPYTSGFNFIEFNRDLNESPDFAIRAGRYTVRAVDAAGCSIDTTLIVASNCCPVVSGLVITNLEVTNGSATADWDDGLPGVLYWHVSERLNDGPWSEETRVLTSEYDLAGLANGQRYGIRVRSICDTAIVDGEVRIISSSEPQEVSFNLTDECENIQNLTVSDITASSFMLSWDATQSAVAYIVTVTEPVSGNQISEKSVSDTTVVSFTADDGIEPGKNYQVSVRADCGAGNLSAEVFEIISTQTECPSITGLNITDIGTRGATVSWEAVLGAAVYIVSYELQGGGAGPRITTTETTVDIPGLECESNYLLTVIAACGPNLESSPSFEVFSTQPCCTAPDAVLSQNVTTSTADLSWNPVPNAAAYIVSYGFINETPVRRRVTTNSISITGLQFNSTYLVEVRSLCGSDTSSAATDLFSTSSTCESVSGLAVNTVTPSTANISWEAAPGVDAYLVEYATSGDFSDAIRLPQTTMTSITIGNLIGNSSYFVRVSGICGGIASSAVSVSFSTLDGCATPSAVVVSRTTAITATIRWNAIGGATSYQVRYRETGTRPWQFRSTPTNEIELGSLQPNAEFEYQVRSLCGPTDFSTWTAADFFRTLNGVACPTAENVTVSNITTTTAVVNFSNVAGATGYEVQVAIAAENPTWGPSINRSGTNAVISGLTAGTDYLVRVRAICSSVTSEWTPNPVPFRTRALREGAVDGALLSAIQLYPNPNKGSFSLNFEADADGIAQMALYDLSGKQVIHQVLSIVGGANNFQFQLEGSLPTGMYVLRLQTESSQLSTKVVVE
jgi:hypothetical protein